VRLNKFNSVESDFYSEKTTGVAERAVDSSVGDAGDRIAASLKASELVRQGHTQIRSRKFAEAVKSLQRAVQVDKETPLAYRGLGICYAELRDTEMACWAYKSYLDRIAAKSKEAEMVKNILSVCR
jgi:Flp pilus assembly protein TadD